MIDFRSDTVTRPCAAMREMMSQAKVGDDVYGDDPTVNQLEQKVAELLGMEAALLVPSGTQSNLVALLTHCGRGDEYLVGQDYHTYLYESGGAACLGSIQPQPIGVEADGTLDLNRVSQLIKPKDVHFANTKLLCLENTHSGKVISNTYLANAISLARENRLAVHLDGARVFNAAVAQGIAVADITSPFDSVSICCSKGLGAPLGSLLSGSNSFISAARRWRKMLGGGMRQAGIIAAAIDYALDNNINRLAYDHQSAEDLQNQLADINELTVESAHTNMLYIDFESREVGLKVAEYLKSKNILIAGGQRVRLVTHLDISTQNIEYFVSQMKLALRELG